MSTIENRGDQVPGWDEHDIPDLTGRTALVTGANSGLGLRTAQVLASRGALVLMACRSPERGQAALRTITAEGGTAELIDLDLADLATVRRAATAVRDRTSDRLDILINNAGLMAPPKRTTVDGFELQFGTNHLGHAALTWLLAPALRGGRVVTLSSPVAATGRMDIDDPNFERRRYWPTAAYGQSKLANLLFALELDRRARATATDLTSVAAHPGYTATSLTANTARSRGTGFLPATMEFIGGLGDRLLAQDVRMGALPQLRAATDPDVRGGQYYGPSRLFGTRGFPHLVAPPRQARDTGLAAALWNQTARLTGVSPDPA